MRARPREPQEGAATSLHPNDEAMWSMWAGECMHDRCRYAADVWITTQLTWRSAVSHWTFCKGHATSWVSLFVHAHMYFLQIEAAGVVEQELPLAFD